jgi:NAD(P)-dependent dehydrogenase (short-subunit alcohol dehydrogenase family)
MSLELAKHGIRVNSLAPDVIRTPGVSIGGTPDSDDRYRRLVPLQRIGQIEDLAGPAVFLASEMSSFVTGATIHVDGGNLAASGWARDHEGRWVTGH